MSVTVLDAGYISGGTVVSQLGASSTSPGGVMSSHPITGLSYFEATITTLTGTPAIGIASSTWNHSTSLGTGNDTVGYLPSGAVKINNVTIATIATYVQGNRIDVAVDSQNRLIWFRVNNGNWNNSGTANPATGVGGIDWSSAFIGTPYMALSWSASGNRWDANFSGPFTDTVPTGYNTLDTANYTTVKSVVNPTELPSGFSSPAGVVASRPSLDQVTTGRKIFSPAGAITVVSGTTKENGSIVSGKRVDVYDRATGDLLDTAYSDGSGNWSAVCLGRPAVRVVGSDPTTYNSQVYDNVVPV